MLKILGNPHFCEKCHVAIFPEKIRPRVADETIVIIVPSESASSVQGAKEKWNRQDNHTYRF